jgi:hypothetical protein
VLNKVSLAFIGALTIAPQMALAADNFSARCIDVSVPKAAIIAHKGTWIELTPEQWQFMRGVYVASPETPPGLPYGDKAALAQVDGNTGGLVFFIDGDKACTPVPVPHEVLDILRDVATLTINHEAAAGV